jgi:large subunit ribosomal protein L31
MKKDIHPQYYTDATVICGSCGATWKTGSTQKEIRTEVCSNCHPFYTGQQQRILDREGQVDRFYKRLQARQDYLEEQQAKEESKISPDRSLTDLGLGTRVDRVLEEAGLKSIADVLERLEGGEKALLEVSGFGRKSLIDLKKALRQQGFKLPEAAEEITV